MLISHGISRLHMCVEFIVFPFSKVILIGDLAGRQLTTSAPSTIKFPVAPESEKFHCMARFSFSILKLVASIGSSRKKLAYTINFPDFCCVVMGSGGGLKNMLHKLLVGCTCQHMLSLPPPLSLWHHLRRRWCQIRTMLSSQQSGKISFKFIIIQFLLISQSSKNIAIADWFNKGGEYGGCLPILDVLLGWYMDAHQDKCLQQWLDFQMVAFWERHVTWFLVDH